MHLERKGRSDIAESMKEYASSGTVSNVLKQYREESKSFNTSDSQNSRQSDRVTTFTEEVLGEVEFKKNPDISIEHHVIHNTEDFEENGYPVDQGQKGVSQGPLSWFTNGYDSSQSQSSLSAEEIKYSNGQNRQLGNTDGPTPEHKSEPPVLETQVNNNDNYLNNHVNSAPEEEEEFEQPQPRSPLSTSKDHQPIGPVEKSVEEKLEQEFFNKERTAWDCYGHAWTQIRNQITKEKDQRRHELLVIDRRKDKLSEWKKQLEQMQLQLTTRETRILEAEPFLGVAKELQNLGMGMGEVLPFFETIREKAEAENIDHKTAAVQIAQELRLNREFGGIQRQIEIAKGQLKMLDIICAQKERGLSILAELQDKGVSSDAIYGFSKILDLERMGREWNPLADNVQKVGQNYSMNMGRNLGQNPSMSMGPEQANGKKLDDKLIGH
jgi:hypothetical protein